eukprot:jgi/Galph1/500/GphlegSOOS_G5177.1
MAQNSNEKQHCPLYSQLGEYTTRILEDYYFSGLKLGLKTVTRNGLIYEAQGKKDFSLEPTCIGEFREQFPFKFQRDKLGFSGFVDCLLHTKGNISCETVVDLTSACGLIASLSATGGEAHRLNTKVNWQQKYVSSSNDLVVGPTKRIESSVVFGYANVFVGGKILWETSQASKSYDWTLVCSYQDGNTGDITLFVHDKGQSITCSYVHHVSQQLSFATRFVYSRNINRRALQFGAQYYLDPNTILKSKVDTCGTIALSCMQEIPSSKTPWKVRIGLSSHIDVASVEKKSPGMGISVELES